MNRSDHDQMPAGVRTSDRPGTLSTFHSRRVSGSCLSVFRMSAAMASTLAATVFLALAGIAGLSLSALIQQSMYIRDFRRLARLETIRRLSNSGFPGPTDWATAQAQT